MLSCVLMKQKNYSADFKHPYALKNVELRYSRYRTDTFGPHTHTSYSIGLILDGKSRVEIGGQKFVARKDDIVCINPNEVHSCNPEKDGKFTYKMLYIGTEYAAKIFPVLFDPNHPVPFCRTIIKETETASRLRKLIESLERENNKMESETLLLEILKEFLDSDETENLHSTMGNLEKAKFYLEKNYEKNICLKETAESANLSEYHFLRAFKKQYGMTPHAFLLQIRLNKAREMLAIGKDTAETAQATGFSDQSHLIRKFKSFAGVTPGEYQRSLKS